MNVWCSNCSFNYANFIFFYSFSSLCPSLSLPPLLLSPLLSLSWSSQFYCSLSITRCENAWNTEKKYRNIGADIPLKCCLHWRVVMRLQMVSKSRTFHTRIPFFTQKWILELWYNLHAMISLPFSWIWANASALWPIQCFFFVFYLSFSISTSSFNVLLTIAFDMNVAVCSTNVNSLQSPSGHWLHHWGKFVLPQLQMSSR